MPSFMLNMLNLYIEQLLRSYIIWDMTLSSYAPLSLPISEVSSSSTLPALGISPSSIFFAPF